MKRIIVAVTVTLSVVAANAGFVTGVVVGAAMSGGKKVSPETGQFLTSDSYDVITCRKATDLLCVVPTGANISAVVGITPLQFVGLAGYKYLNKLGVFIQDGREYFVMEVSK